MKLPPYEIPIQYLDFRVVKAMTTEQKQAQQLLIECRGLRYDTKNQRAAWGNELAHDLNQLLVRAGTDMSWQSPSRSEMEHAEATLRVVKRVAEFEGIKTV